MPADDQIGLLSDPALQTHRTKTTCGSEIFSYLRPPPADAPPSEDRPLLVLLHGYPQTSYIWRHLLGPLPPSYPLFIPDLPGYGRSSPSRTTHDKLAIGLAVLEALHTVLHDDGRAPSPKPTPVVLIGHDRGARIAHRLALTFSHPTSNPTNPNPLPAFTIHGLALLDTVPELAQWSTFASPPAAASSFHWPFLANAELATAMIEAYGARRWCGMLLERWSGGGSSGSGGGGSSGSDDSPNSRGEVYRFKHDDDAVEAYCGAFERPGVVRATCEDYAASVGADREMHEGDERAGRKVALGGGRGVLAVYSGGYLAQKGARDVERIWRGYVDDGTRLVARGIGGGAGHYLTEEAPGEVAEVLLGWLEGRA